MDKSLRVQVIMGAVDRLTSPLRNVLKGTKGLSAGLKETTQKLRDLNAAQKDVGRFRELKAGAAATAAELDQARAKAAALAGQFNAATNPTRKLTREFAKARETVNSLEAAHQAQARELQEVRGRMNAAGLAGQGLARHEKDLKEAIAKTNAELEERKSKLLAVTKQQDRVAAARSKFDKSQELAGNLAGAGAGATAAGAVLLAPLIAANKTAGDYEATLTTVAQKADLNRKAATGLGVELTRVGQATNQLPADVVAATDALTGLGAELGQARKMIPAIGQASTAYEASMEDMGRASYAAVDTLKVPAEQTAKVLDVMALAGKKGAFEVADMAQYFPSLTAAAAGLGQTGVGAVADLAAALQITRKGAGDSAEAATNLGNLLQKISSPLTVKNFKKFGVDLEKELKAAAKRGESPIETITKLTQQATGGDLSKLGYLFEDAQVQKALRPLIQNLGLYQSIRKEALAADGTVAADFAERLRDQNQAAKAAAINVRALGLTIGAQLAPTVTAVAGVVGRAAGAVTSWAQKNPELAGTLAKIVGVLGLALVVIGGLALGVAAFLGPFALANLAVVQALPALSLLGGGFLAVGRAIATAGAFAMANPIVLVVAAIAVAAFLLIRYWKPISAFFVGLWNKIAAAFAGAVSWVRQHIPQIIQGALMLMGPVGMIIANWSRIAPFFAAVWGRVQAGFASVGAWFQGLGAKFREFGTHLIAGLIAGITGRLAELKSTVVGVASKAAAWFKEKLGIHSPSRVFSGFGGDTMAGLAVGLQRGQREPLDVVAATAARMAQAMAQGAMRTPAGMVAAGGLAAAAVAAPAAFAGQSAAPAPITINIYPAPGADPQAIAKAVAAELDKRQRAKSARSLSGLADTSEH